LVSYIVCGFEYGENNETEHLQGYVQFKNRIEQGAIKRRFNARAHLEIQRGTTDEAINYCKKDKNFYEDGIPTYQGKKRCDMARAIVQILDGATEEELIDTHGAGFIINRSRLYDSARKVKRQRQFKVQYFILAPMNSHKV
jgi:hypothetical protein